jgi:hypothetical protein
LVQVPLTPAQRTARWRARRRGENVPKLPPGRRANDAYFEQNAQTPEAIVGRLLTQAKLENWDGTIAAAGGESEARQVMEKLLSMIRKDAE